MAIVSHKRSRSYKYAVSLTRDIVHILWCATRPHYVRLQTEQMGNKRHNIQYIGEGRLDFRVHSQWQQQQETYMRSCKVKTVVWD